MKNSSQLQKILLTLLILCVLFAAALLIGQLWLKIASEVIFIKLLATIGVIFLAICFLMITFLENGSRYKAYLLVPYVELAGLLVLDQIWTSIFAIDVFIKALVTLGVLFAITGLIIVIKSDFSFNKKLKDQNFME